MILTMRVGYLMGRVKTRDAFWVEKCTSEDPRRNHCELHSSPKGAGVGGRVDTEREVGRILGLKFANFV